MAWCDFAGICLFSDPPTPHLLQTKAYEYFQRAADMKQDGDSLFNAGHCLATGTGTKQDYRRYVSVISPARKDNEWLKHSDY